MRSATHYPPLLISCSAISRRVLGCNIARSTRAIQYREYYNSMGPVEHIEQVLTVSRKLAGRCEVGVVTIMLDGAPITDEHVAVPLGTLDEQQADLFRQALPLLEQWTEIENVSAWFAALAEVHPVQLHERVAAAQRVADFLNCNDFLRHVATCCLFYLTTAGEAGFRQLSATNTWPAGDVQFSPKVLQELRVVEVDMLQLLPGDQATFDRLISPDVFDDAIDSLDTHSLLFLDPVSIRRVLLWLGFTPGMRVCCKLLKQYYHADVPYATLRLPSALLERYSVTAMKVTASAHDQGWCSDQDAGTWTFADLAVCSPKQSGSTEPLFRLERVYTNKQASSEWQQHNVELTQESALLNFLNGWGAGAHGDSHGKRHQQNKAGLLLELRMRAMFPGWEHHVRQAELTVTLTRRVGGLLEG